MSIEAEPFELFAIRYATEGGRKDIQNFLTGNRHQDSSDLDYYVWVAKRSDRVVVVDTGMTDKRAALRGQDYLRSPVDAMRLLGVDAQSVEDVVLSHLHFDHAGMLDRFPKARFHVQDAEMAYATGRCMCTRFLRGGYDIEDVVHVVRCAHAGQVQFHDNSSEIMPGLSVHRVGGHTGGLQVTRVWTRRGWVVLASDSAHLYQHIEDRRPFPGVYRVDEMMEGHRTILTLANGSLDHVVPGHDPRVMKMYPAPASELENVVARLDRAPNSSR